MKKPIGLAIALFAALSFAQGWRTITVRDAGLSFSMPVLPQASKRTDQDRNVVVQTRMWVGSQPNTNYVVIASTVPPNAPAGFAKNMKEGMLKGFLNSTGSKVDSDKDASYGKVKGRQITFTSAAGAKGALWIVERGRRIYSLSMARQKGAIDPDRAKFFGSLKLYD
jgi:hypothetical protein